GNRQARGDKEGEGHISRPGGREENTAGAQAVAAFSTPRERGDDPRHHGSPGELPRFQGCVHRDQPHGVGPTEDHLQHPASLRPALPLLSIPVAERLEVHPQRERSAQGLEAVQPRLERQLRPGHLRLRVVPGGRARRGRDPNRVRPDSMVPRPRAAVLLQHVRHGSGHVERRVHLRGAGREEALLPGEEPHAPASDDCGRARESFRGGLVLH
ncbi:unnamed protein product, partial [Ectocarpus fasciculatus]